MVNVVYECEKCRKKWSITIEEALVDYEMACPVCQWDEPIVTRK